MKLRRALVENFCSIVKSEEFDVEPGVTVVIGKNEQGKTNLLRGLLSFNPDYKYKPSDLPNHLRPALAESDQAKVPVVTVWLSIEPDDKAELVEVVRNVEAVQQLRITKFLDGHYDYATIDADGVVAALNFAPPAIAQPVAEQKIELDALRATLSEHAVRQPAFAPSAEKAEQLINDFQNGNFADSATLNNLVETFIAGLKGLPGQDAPIQADFETVQKKLLAVKSKIADALARDPKVLLISHLPVFALHEAGSDRIPDEVPTAAFIMAPTKTSRGMANLCKAAGLSIQKIQDLAKDASGRSAYEDYYTNKISGAINEFWTQAEYVLSFRFSNGNLTVFVADDTYGNRIPPSARSDGFQWYLSFYSALTADAASGGERVLLLDNPGLELHSDGQHDVKRFLEQKQSQNTQVIYVTHSPAMVDPYRLEQVRKVERFGNAIGTKVAKLRFEGGVNTDLLEPVRTAIGSSLVNSLIVNETNVLVEGAADKPILEGAALQLDPENRHKTSVNGSIAETGSFLPKFYEKARLPYVVFLDHDSRGRELGENLKREGIPAEKIIGLGQ